MSAAARRAADIRKDLQVAERPETIMFTRGKWHADTQFLVDYLERTEARLAALREALESIAKNTCCERCQEAALVARAALRRKEGKE